MLAKVISGFPGVGKTAFACRGGQCVLDSDSTSFSWCDKGTDKGTRNPDFPDNYIRHIQSYMFPSVDYILVSSHKSVRDALRAHDIHYTLVYPAIGLKDEYIKRYKARGNADSFISFISENWEGFIKDIESETFPELMEIQSGIFLSDIF